MRHDAWLTLLGRLIALTEARNRGWEAADLPGAYILSQPSGSVVVRVTKELAGHRTFTLEIRDPDGQVRADLTTSESSPPYANATETAQLLERLRRLVAAIEEGDKAGEDLANAILDDAEGSPADRP
jgi:hypothetical protein